MTPAKRSCGEFNAVRRNVLSTGFSLAVCLVALWAALPGLRGGETGPSAVRELSIVGSRALQQPVADWLEMYRRLHPNVRVHSAMYGSGLAASAMAQHRANIAPLNRMMLGGEQALLEGRSRPVAVKVGDWFKRDAVRQPVYLYVAREVDGTMNREALDFVRVAISEAGQSRLHAAGFGSLSLEDIGAARQKIDLLMEDERTAVRESGRD